MTQKTPDSLSKIVEQITQIWEKVAPNLQLLLLKLLKSLIPALEKLNQQVVPSGQIATGWRSIAAKVLIFSIDSLAKFQTKLEENIAAPKAPAVDLAANEAALPAAKPTMLTGKPQSGSWQEAKKFSREQLIPSVLAYSTKTVEWLEPRLTPVWEKVEAKAKATPALVNAWEKVQSHSLWKKGLTAIAPIWRFITEKLEPVTSSEQLKPILEKRVAVNTILAVLVLFFLFKPSPVRVAKAPQKSPVVASRPATGRDFVIPAEKGDSPISPEQIMISDIQAQVAGVTKQYGEALIQSVQTNFKLGRLIVQLSDAWYQITPQKQEQLMADLFQRSTTLNFKKLLVADSTNHLLARSPAIGGEMVILRR